SPGAEFVFSSAKNPVRSLSDDELGEIYRSASKAPSSRTRQQPRETLDLETLDALKRQLDVRIKDLEAKPSPDGDLIASLKANRQSIVEDLDAASPAYRQ